jgi:ribosome maturation factor RimP
MRTVEIVALIGTVVAEQGAELVELQSTGSERRPVLRAYVDIPGGTTADACARLSRAIEARLDASGLVGERYVLEVSSPGLDRRLRTRRDFARLVGRPVEVHTRRGGEAPRRLVGVLEEVGGEQGGGGFWIALRPERGRETVRVPADDIASAKAHMPW